MFQMFASALFGGDAEETGGRGKEEEDDEDDEDAEDWVVLNYLTETCSAPRGDVLPGSTVGPEEDDAEEEEEEDEGLVMLPSPMPSPSMHYSSSSLNFADGGAEEEEKEEEEEEEEEKVASGFLRVDARSLQESWFVTPPPCFIGRNLPALLTSPLENLLIEHPSMSVYTRHMPLCQSLEPPPPYALDPDPDLMTEDKHSPPAATDRHLPESPRRRQEVAQRRSALYAAACSGLLQPRPGHVSPRSQPLSRKGLRRRNLLRPKKSSPKQLRQPSQRQLNY